MYSVEGTKDFSLPGGFMNSEEMGYNIFRLVIVLVWAVILALLLTTQNKFMLVKNNDAKAKCFEQTQARECWGIK
jgi:hypothetical protein